MVELFLRKNKQENGRVIAWIDLVEAAAWVR